MPGTLNQKYGSNSRILIKVYRNYELSTKFILNGLRCRSRGRIKVKMWLIIQSNRKGLHSQLLAGNPSIAERSASGLRCAGTASTESTACPQHKSEVVPSAAVVDFVEVYVVRKQRDDERDRTNESVPQAEPESGDATVGSSGVCDRIGSSRTASQHDNSQQRKGQQGQLLFHD
ncbi:MAG: hypothetical protein RJA61_230 [Candidatus Parcubacteria bacterium]